MFKLPAPVLDYLQSSVVEYRLPAYLFLNNEGRLIDWGGRLETYGISQLRKGEQITERVHFLEGLLPIEESPITLPYVKTESGLVADVHLIAGAEGAWIVLLDSTEDARQRQIMQQKGNELSLNYQRLVKEIQKKEILLHCIVHDLAGPLMGIKGGFELLAEENISEKGRKFLEIGLRQATKQATLIREILQAFSAEVDSLEEFAVDPDRAPDALRAAKEVIEALSPAFALNQVKVRLDPNLDVNKNWKVVGEKSRLERVISNLVENALRYSPANSAVTVGLHDEDDKVLITIDDDGPGIPPELAGSLFQKFTQAKNRTGKIGLGLYFCRITVEHWGGEIGNLAREQGGTRFWFRLPRPQIQREKTEQTKA
jgi:signal transduction histidine kinase